MKYFLFNPMSNNNHGGAKAKEFCEKLGGGEMKDVTKLDAKAFMAGLEKEDVVYLIGGDGTINFFANDLYGEELKNEVYFCPAGTGNDFMNDVRKEEGQETVLLNDYIKDLPLVEVNGLKRRFINGIGYGLDGMCCQIADDMKAQGKTEINYTSIAIKLLLLTYKQKKAKVVVDGVEHEFKNVWILPTMKGRFYGGGMMVAPAQDRLDNEGKVTVVVFGSMSRLKTLICFPKIFKGEHVNLKMTTVLTGKEVYVEYDKPTALQIDGETVRNVKSYTVKA